MISPSSSAAFPNQTFRVAAVVVVVAHVIVAAGWTALSYDVRGHGHSPGVRGYIDHFETYLDDRSRGDERFKRTAEMLAAKERDIMEV